MFFEIKINIGYNIQSKNIIIVLKPRHPYDWIGNINNSANNVYNFVNFTHAFPWHITF